MSLIRARYRAVNTVMSLGGASFVGLLDLFPNAAAAYSLRKLRAAYSGAAVRVRRSSDNTEQDIGFDANGDLDTASLLSFVNADVNTFVSDFANSESIIELGGTGQSNQSIGGRTGLYKFTYTGGATTHQAFLTGKHPDSNNTYSVIFNIYFPTGQACNGFTYLKPDGTSDTNHNLTQGVWHSFSYTDINGGSNLSRFIPSVNGVANTADDGANFYLDAWVITQTTADGHVTTWYDQSLSNDATQTTAANQPKIVSAGSLVTENGKAAIQFDGVDDYFTLGGTNDAGMLGDISIFSVNKNLGTSTSVIISTGLTGSSSALVMQWSLTGGTSSQYIGTTSDGTTRINENVTATNYGSQVLVSMINDESGNLQLFADGVGSSGQTAVAPMNDAAYPLQIGRDVFRSSYYFSGSMQELVMYSSLPNRTTIETNINGFYNIYP